MQLLKECIKTNIFIPFVPLHERLFKKAGTIKKELQPLFPGYVFNVSSQEFINRISSVIYGSQNIFSILRSSDKEIAMENLKSRCY